MNSAFPPPIEPSSDERLRRAGATLRMQFTLLLIFVALFWGLEIIDWLSRGVLDNFGIRPRNPSSLINILFAPFLHFGFGHVAANSVPFFVLGWFVLLRDRFTFFAVTILSMLIGGFGIWLIGESESIHLGASILVFGYFGFLLLNALFERSLRSISLTLVAILLYGSLIWGVLPLLEGVSWEGHLFGFIGGGVAARYLTRPEQLSN